MTRVDCKTLMVNAKMLNLYSCTDVSSRLYSYLISLSKPRKGKLIHLDIKVAIYILTITR